MKIFKNTKILWCFLTILSVGGQVQGKDAKYGTFVDTRYEKNKGTNKVEAIEETYWTTAKLDRIFDHIKMREIKKKIIQRETILTAKTKMELAKINKELNGLYQERDKEKHNIIVSWNKTVKNNPGMSAEEIAKRASVRRVFKGYGKFMVQAYLLGTTTAVSILVPPVLIGGVMAGASLGATVAAVAGAAGLTGAVTTAAQMALQNRFDKWIKTKEAEDEMAEWESRDSQLFYNHRTKRTYVKDKNYLEVEQKIANGKKTRKQEGYFAWLKGEIARIQDTLRAGSKEFDVLNNTTIEKLKLATEAEFKKEKKEEMINILKWSAIAGGISAVMDGVGTYLSEAAKAAKAAKVANATKAGKIVESADVGKVANATTGEAEHWLRETGMEMGSNMVESVEKVERATMRKSVDDLFQVIPNKTAKSINTSVDQLSKNVNLRVFEDDLFNFTQLCEGAGLTKKEITGLRSDFLELQSELIKSDAAAEKLKKLKIEYDKIVDMEYNKRKIMEYRYYAWDVEGGNNIEPLIGNLQTKLTESRNAIQKEAVEQVQISKRIAQMTKKFQERVKKISNLEQHELALNTNLNNMQKIKLDDLQTLQKAKNAESNKYLDAFPDIAAPETKVKLAKAKAQLERYKGGPGKLDPMLLGHNQGKLLKKVNYDITEVTLNEFKEQTKWDIAACIKTNGLGLSDGATHIESDRIYSMIEWELDQPEGLMPERVMEWFGRYMKERYNKAIINDEFKRGMHQYAMVYNKLSKLTHK